MITLRLVPGGSGQLLAVGSEGANVKFARHRNHFAREDETGALFASYDITVRDFCNTITPVVGGTSAFISNTSTNGTARLDFAGAEPRVVWRKSELGMLFNSPVLWQGCLYSFNDSNRKENELVCLDAATGETLWTYNDVEKGVFTLADGKMFLLTRLSELVILALNDKEPSVLACVPLLGGRSWADPVRADGRIYCRNNDGQAVCVDAR